MKYILLFLTIIYGGIYLPLWCGQYDKAAFFISMCVLFTQWCFDPRKASITVFDGSPPHEQGIGVTEAATEK